MFENEKTKKNIECNTIENRKDFILKWLINSSSIFSFEKAVNTEPKISIAKTAIILISALGLKKSVIETPERRCTTAIIILIRITKKPIYFEYAGSNMNLGFSII
jgi:hypothetical protein